MCSFVCSWPVPIFNPWDSHRRFSYWTLNIYLCRRCLCVCCVGWDGSEWFLHGVRRCEQVQNPRSNRKRKLRRSLLCHRRGEWWKGGDKEDTRYIRTHLRCGSNPTWDQTSEIVETSRHCGDKTHHASSVEKRFQGYLRRVRTDGIGSSSGHQSQRRSHQRTLSVLSVPAIACTQIHPHRQCLSQRFEAQEHTCECQLQAQDLRFGFGQSCVQRHSVHDFLDGIQNRI